jgi:phosphoribosylamine--glycine ligase
MDTVLIVGGGAREHALLKALLRSDRAICTFAYPGNPGMESDGCMLIDRKIDSWKDLAEWASDNDVNLTIVGPEQPLCEGIVDEFRKHGLTIFGPTAAAARIEGSKHFAKSLMKKYGIPTAAFESFTSKSDAEKYLEKTGAPVVVKASGLAAGKGAIVCDTLQEAKDALSDIFDKKVFGEAGATVIIEEKMFGEEASVFAITDGKSYKILPVSQDHKPAFDGDKGPNTGGMGAYAPAPLVDSAMLLRIEKEIIAPVLKAMEKEKSLYQGLLYAGVMITEQGPKVVEFNCRFGDPETEAVLPLVQCDWFDLFSACSSGRLSKVNWTVKKGACVTVIMASGGYPGTYKKGEVINGLEEAEHGSENVDVYQAGTILDNEGRLVTNGGRVLAVSAYGESLEAAVKAAYEYTVKINFKGAHYRKDIAAKGLARKQ